MSIEPIGIATIVLGLLCFGLGQRAIVVALVSLSILGASSAMFVGGNNIMPAYLFLGFAILSLMMQPRQIIALLGELAPPRPAFWLMCLVFYGACTAFLLPRLMSGVTQIIPLGRFAYEVVGGTVPLGPVSSNMTQALYMTGNLVFMLFVIAVGSTRDGFRTILAAVLTYSVLDIFFALIDIATFTTGTQSLLDFMRNAQYTMHHEEQVFGLKRIVGSFPETSSFARATMGVLGFSATLWLCGRQSLLTGTIAASALLLIIFSTSSTGLAIVPVMIGLLFLTAVKLVVLDKRTRNGLALVVLGVPILLVIAGLVIALNKEAYALVKSYLDIIVLNKLSTNSGIERTNWNTVAIQNILDTWGIGVGLGTNRTSSFILALVSNLGIVGLLLYSAFIFTAFIRIREKPGTYVADVKLAARNACLGLIAADMLASPVIDQGFFFYALAGLAACRPDAQNFPKTKRPQYAPVPGYGSAA